MKVKDIRKFINACNNEIKRTESCPLPSLVTPTKIHPSSYSVDGEGFIHQEIDSAMASLGLDDNDPVGSDEIDLIFKCLKQRLRKRFNNLKRKAIEDSKDLSKVLNGVKNDELYDALCLTIKSVELYRVASAQSALRIEEEDLTELDRLVTAWTGGSDPRVKFVLAHWIWLIKRKLNKKPVINHIMPILYGAQSCGKSRAVSGLLSPFKELGLTLYSSISQFSDERYIRVLADHYVVFADEMSQAEKADINSFKNIITADELSPRKLGTNSAFHIKQNCSFIGASNRPTNEMIFDPTGMRRFYQINCLPKMDWKTINGIDYVGLIKGIDERKPDGYLTKEILDDVRQQQDELISHDDIFYFLEERGYRPGIPSDLNFISHANLFESYIAWVESEGSTFKHSKHELTKRLKNKGFQAISKNLGGKTARGFWIRATSKDKGIIL